MKPEHLARRINKVQMNYQFKVIGKPNTDSVAEECNRENDEKEPQDTSRNEEEKCEDSNTTETDEPLNNGKLEVTRRKQNQFYHKKYR